MVLPVLRFALGLLAGLLLSAAAARADDGTIRVTGYAEYGRTASGLMAGPGLAACPYWLAFGQAVHLSGKVELDVQCADRYSRLLSDRIDVWVRYSREAYALTGMYAYTLLAASEEP